MVLHCFSLVKPFSPVIIHRHHLVDLHCFSLVQQFEAVLIHKQHLVVLYYLLFVQSFEDVNIHMNHLVILHFVLSLANTYELSSTMCESLTNLNLNDSNSCADEAMRVNRACCGGFSRSCSAFLLPTITEHE